MPLLLRQFVLLLFTDPKVQGSREFRDMNGVLLWPMMINVARAAYIYSPEVVELWGQVFSTCNSMGGMAAEGLGYGMAYIYAEGIVESIGLTKIMQSAYKQGQAAFNGDGCKALNSLLDGEVLGWAAFGYMQQGLPTIAKPAQKLSTTVF